MSTIGIAIGLSFGCGLIAVSSSLNTSLRTAQVKWAELVRNDSRLAARVSLAAGVSVIALFASTILKVAIVVSVVIAVAASSVALVFQTQQWNSAENAARFRIALATPAWLDVLTLGLVAGLPLSVAIGQAHHHGSRELVKAWQAIQNSHSVPIAVALSTVYSDADDPATRRVASSLLIALERGTPVADVLEDLSSEIRSENRRKLLEIAAKKDVTMMLPVVFGILPAVTVIALYPALQTLTSLR
ncbi:MAG: hypothetical protein RL410_1504 [Actinomycetota bacterium]